MTLSIILSSCVKFKIHDRKLIKISECIYAEGNYLCSVSCSSHEYDINGPKRITNSATINPEDCTDTVGFSVDAWAEDITPTIKALKKQYR